MAAENAGEMSAELLPLDLLHLVREESPLDGGAYADVYAGSYYGTPVAIKRMRPPTRSYKKAGMMGWGDQQDHGTAFRKEAGAWSLLRHPNIVTLYGAAETPDRILVMELMDQSLAQVLFVSRFFFCHYSLCFSFLIA